MTIYSRILQQWILQQIRATELNEIEVMSMYLPVSSSAPHDTLQITGRVRTRSTLLYRNTHCCVENTHYSVQNAYYCIEIIPLLLYVENSPFRLKFCEKNMLRNAHRIRLEYSYGRRTKPKEWRERNVFRNTPRIRCAKKRDILFAKAYVLLPENFQRIKYHSDGWQMQNRTFYLRLWNRSFFRFPNCATKRLTT